MTDGQFKLTDFPPEILERFLPDFEPKTVSAMKLVCNRFYQVFTRDIYFKACLLYPENDYELDLRFESRAEGVKEIVEEIKNGTCDRWKGFVRLQHQHLKNLRSNKLDSFEVVSVKGLSLSNYCEGSDAENGRWLVCLFGHRRVTLLNLATGQKLYIDKPPQYHHIIYVLFKRGVVILKFWASDYIFSVYKLEVQGAEYSINLKISVRSHDLLLQARIPPRDVCDVKLIVGVWPRMLMAVHRPGCCITSHHNFGVVDVETGEVTHTARFPAGTLVMPSLETVHALFPDIEKACPYRILPKPDTELGTLERVWSRNLKTTDSWCFLNSSCLVWQFETVVRVLKVNGEVFDEEEQVFEVSPDVEVIGFLRPDVVITTVSDGAQEGPCVLPGRTRSSNVRKAPWKPLDWTAQELAHRRHPGRLRLDQWLYPNLKVVLSRKVGKHYEFKVHHF